MNSASPARSLLDGTPGPTRGILTNPADSARAAMALAGGAVAGHGFANFYALTARADRETVRRVNALKGRPLDQVGSITAPPSRIVDLFDWAALPAGVSRKLVLDLVDALYVRGPFGFRGPAAAHLPEHLTLCEAGVVTTQLIAPGYACPANQFLAQALRATGDDLLYITSANRSRHLTGADDTPAHWRADALAAEFAHQPDLTLLAHADESATRAAYPGYLPMSTTVLGFHQPHPGQGDRRPQFVLERHGSLPVDDVRQVLDELGAGLLIGPRAGTRLTMRHYPDNARK